jgi:hypothetical protein
MNTKSVTLLRSTLIVVLLAAFVLVGCSGNGPALPEGTIVGSGKAANEGREVAGFTSVVLEAPGYLTISQGDVESLTVQAEDNIIPLITTEVVDGVLTIGVKPNTNIKTNNMISYTLTVKDLTSIENLGSGYVSIAGLTTTDLTYKSSGSGNLKLTGLDAKSVKLDLVGSGSADVRGAADSLNLMLSGSGRFSGASFTVANADVSSTGSGTASINASAKLNVSITGSGSVEYSGAPELTKNITGSGTLNLVD